MIDSVYLDWAIGLAVVFFLGGALVSGLTEGLNWITRVRAKFFWAYLYDLFTPQSTPAALPGGILGIVRLWGTSLGLSQRDKRPLVSAANPSRDSGEEWGNRLASALNPILAKQLFGKRTALSQVPPTALAQALVEAFADVGREKLSEWISTILDANASEENVATTVSALKERLRLDVDLASAVAAFRESRSEANADAMAALLDRTPPRDAMRAAWRSADQDAIVTAIVREHPALSERARIEQALAGLDADSPVTKTLRRLWAAAQGKVDNFRGDLERYLDADLQRLSGYYRRSIRVVMLVLAGLVAVFGGIDVIAFAQSTWRDAGARDALVQRADAIANTPMADDEGTVLGGLRERCVTEGVREPPAEPFNTKIEADEKLADFRSCVNDSIDELTGVNVLGNALWSDPSGWAHEWTNRPLWHGVGTILAALGLMLGAPFWFDVIRRLTGIRKPRTAET